MVVSAFPHHEPNTYEKSIPPAAYLPMIGPLQNGNDDDGRATAQDCNGQRRWVLRLPLRKAMRPMSDQQEAGVPIPLPSRTLFQLIRSA